MLSARVNFLVQPAKEQGTAFSAVWILECREAWPDVVKVFSHLWESRKRQGNRLAGLSLEAVAPAESPSYETDRPSLGALDLRFRPA